MTYILVRKIIGGQHFRATPRAWRALLSVCTYHFFLICNYPLHTLKYSTFLPFSSRANNKFQLLCFFTLNSYVCTIQNTSIDVTPIRRHPPRSAMQCFWVFYLFFVLGGIYELYKIHACMYST